MKKQRRKHTSEFKARSALEAIKGIKTKEKYIDSETEQLHRKVGQLTMEVEFLEKKCKQLGIPVRGRNS